ncbi:MAG: aminopeptidase [Bacillota bacterium]|jgi:leucyl aminopeptidase (aminopeptidase T)|nr:aminopeptidase [Clostridia bacterium]
MESKLIAAAKTALLDCMGMEPAEKVLIVTDTELRELGEIFFNQARDFGGEAILTEMLPRKSNGEEPPAPVAAAMKEADVVLLVTKKSLSHTQARKEANKAGARIASLPGLTRDMMARALNADYEQIETLSKSVSRLLSQGKKARLTTPAGTDLILDLSGREGHPDTGFYREKGMFGNLPAGEAYIAPLENTAQGVLVVDGSMAGIGRIKHPITIHIRNGYAEEINGGEEAAILNSLLAPHGKAGRNIAELGIGTNPHAELTGEVLEDEKILGTVHVALGDNHTIGGIVEVSSHLDGVVLSPTLEIDGLLIIKDGKPVC